MGGEKHTSAASGGAFRDKNLLKQGQLSVSCLLKAMLLDVSADPLRCDLVTYCPSTIAIFPAFPAPQAPLNAWELTKDGPGTHTLEPCDDVRDGVPGREGAKDMDMVRTHLHVLNGDVILLRNIGKELPHPLLYLALQHVSPVLGDLQKNKIPYIVEPLTGTSSQVLSTAERFL